MRLSVVDAGSNTVRLVVTDATDGVPLPVHTAKWKLRLSEQVAAGRSLRRAGLRKNWSKPSAEPPRSPGVGAHAGLVLDPQLGVPWNTLRESAVYGADAHWLITAARRALNVA
jgi:hypothetical protein